MDKFAFAPVIPFVFGAAAFLLACSAATDAGIEDAEKGLARDGDGGNRPVAARGGTCFPTASVRLRSLGTGCSATYGGLADVVEGSITAPILGTKIALDLGASGAVASAGGSKSGAAPSVNVAGYVTGVGGTATAVATDGQTSAASLLKDLSINVGGLRVSATSVGSQALAVCGSAVTGSSTVAGLAVGGQSIAVTGVPNQKVVSGALTVVVNEQVAVANGIRVNALHVSAAGVLDVTVAGSLASILCSCPSDAGSGVGVGVGVGSSSGSIGVGSSSGGVVVGIEAGASSSSGGGASSSGAGVIDAGLSTGADAGSSTGADAGDSTGADASIAPNDAGPEVAEPSAGSGNDAGGSETTTAAADGNAQTETSTLGGGRLGDACSTTEPCAAGYGCSTR